MISRIGERIVASYGRNPHGCAGKIDMMKNHSATAITADIPAIPPKKK